MNYSHIPKVHHKNIPDALTQVQQLNGFVPSPALLNSPSFLAPLFQSVTASTNNNDQMKTVKSPVLTSPNRESLSVIMQAAMSGMGSLAGYSFTQLTPTQLTPYAVATSSSAPITATTTSVLQQQQQQQPVGSSSATPAIMHLDDITMKNELPGCSSVTSLQSESINDTSTYDAYATSESNEMEACASSIRSSVSPRSQEEHVFMGSFSGDSYDALEQEKKKLERKRARNRLAASKCRQKKLQKINDLEKQVEEEKLRASRLNGDLKLLETSIAQLRQLLQEHHNNGCPISAKVIST
uniref:BZIP domain-containing protein n=1 Tax=Onchocerca volvulus TaxID=6282 RepID=A0A8R1TJM0_ONCVO